MKVGEGGLTVISFYGDITILQLLLFAIFRTGNAQRLRSFVNRYLRERGEEAFVSLVFHQYSHLEHNGDMTMPKTTPE